MEDTMAVHTQLNDLPTDEVMGSVFDGAVGQPQLA